MEFRISYALSGLLGGGGGGVSENISPDSHFQYLRNKHDIKMLNTFHYCPPLDRGIKDSQMSALLTVFIYCHCILRSQSGLLNF